ncbi:MAG: hypothetical protein IJ523_02705 [Succinivibrionaceae bacterium]|nr:hypothetical protein [Succinivibrionaceae bacterium]
MEYYQFEKIVKNVKKNFNLNDDMIAADEFLVYTMEYNIYKVHVKYPEISSGRVAEAILIVLHKINSYLTGKAPGTERFENADNLKMAEALLYTVDPHSNKDMMGMLTESRLDLEDRDDQIRVYTPGVTALLTLYRLVNAQMQKEGSNGYLVFLDEFLPRLPSFSEAMEKDNFEYTVFVPVDSPIIGDEPIVQENPEDADCRVGLGSLGYKDIEQYAKARLMR